MDIKRRLRGTGAKLFVGTFLAGFLSPVVSGGLPSVPPGIDHTPWEELAAAHVDEKGLVDYAAWHDSAEDRAKLDAYLEAFALAPDEAARGDDKIASLINAYNAFTIQFILENYPTESIRLLDNPFDGKRHLVGGQKISVDDIEHEMLRPLIGWKVHSVVVCAARSCPPLLDRAYFAGDWEEKMEERYRTWLAREDLNTYDPDRGRRGTAEISRIFRWYSEDFEGEHSIESVLGRYGPDEHRSFLRGGGYRVRYQSYHWGLNDQGPLGEDYSHSILRSLF